MTDVMKIAQEKRARLMERIEDQMAEVERLDDFIMFAAKLTNEDAPASEEASAEDEPTGDDTPAMAAE